MTSPTAHLVDLEPSLVAQSTYVTRRRYTLVDVPAVLSIMICLLYLVPEGLILPNLNIIGRPALVVAFLLWCWWIMARLNPWLIVVGPQPLRWVALVYLLALMLSYLAGMLRGLTSLESNGQDTAMLAAFQFLGVLLVTADGLPNWERLYGVLRVLVWCAGFMAVTGILQAALKIDITRYFVVPGLQLKGVVASALTAILMVVKPGLVGTVRAMFSNAGNDPSIEGRTQDYAHVSHWFAQRPWLGRGPFTLIPDLCRGIVLDNQWLYSVVTQGIVGVAVLAMMHLTGITLAAIALRRSKEAEVRHLCAALISTQIIAILVEGTVDAFYYTTYTSTLALLLGMSGAIWRFTHPARTVRTSTVRKFVD